MDLNQFGSYGYLQYSHHLQFKYLNTQGTTNMIRRQGDYYQIDDSQPQQPQSPPQTKQQMTTLSATGNIKDTLSDIRSRLNELKSQKERERRQKGHGQGLIGVGQTMPKDNNHNILSINLTIPDELLLLEKRVQDLQGKINANELFRQKYERKGTIVDRVRTLHKQLQKLVEKRSPQITINNIQTYSTYLEEKEDQMKPLFLYQALQTTRSLNDEILILEEYLTGLSKIQAKLNAGIPLQQLIQTHQQLLVARRDISKSIRVLFSKMTSEYQSIEKEIKEIEESI